MSASSSLPRGRHPIATGLGENKRPDPTWIFVLLAALVIEVILTLLGGYGANLGCALLGLFGVAILLGRFRIREAALRAGGRYSDWRFRARRIAVIVAASGWILGLVNVFFVAKEWTR